MNKTSLLLTCLLLAACTADEPGKPVGKANILHKTGYLMQCASNKSCPAMYNEPTSQQYRQDRASIQPPAAPHPVPQDSGSTEPDYNF